MYLITTRRITSGDELTRRRELSGLATPHRAVVLEQPLSGTVTIRTKAIGVDLAKGIRSTASTPVARMGERLATVGL
jgi:hypothetical protein